jgi:hypothetical protein
MPKDEADECLVNSKDRPMNNDQGEWIWENADVHYARVNVGFPGLNWLDRAHQQINRNEWDITSMPAPKTALSRYEPPNPTDQSTLLCTN